LSPDRPNNQADLWQRIADGDEAAFGVLFHLWRDKLYFFILRITGVPEIAEDILQDVFVKLWVNRSKLTDIQNCEAYFYKVCQNQAITCMRRMAQETLILAEMGKTPDVQGLTADEVFCQKELRKKIQAIIYKLPAQQRQVYTMIREQGLKHEEIAAQLKISASTVKNHMTHALHTIRQELSQHYRVISLYWLLVMAFMLRR
jgi:RNA polymerase sigma-70 factor (ECF subfamily)